MKNYGKGGTAGTLLPSPTSSGGVQVYHDDQRVSFKTHPGNGHPAQNGPRPCREQVALGRGVKDGALRGSAWAMEAGSPACSGTEDNSTDPHETLTESSTLTFVDAHTTEDSSDARSLRGVGMVYLKEFVLIDDDDDGDMSLREKTVTDLSAPDGGAADLVCRRLFSSSSGSVSDGKVESPPPEDPPPEDPRKPPGRCCVCSIL